jgi:transcription factor C subunit 3
MVPVDPQIMAKSAEAEAEARTETETQKSFRVFVTEERMWLAITGHGPDHARVPAFEFPLLSIIASRKGCGIAQTDLTRLSGQDKRSLPKRTDELARKGYIVKKVVQYRSNRTSWCTLRKFAGTTDRDEVNPQEGFFNLDAFIDRLINCLKEFKIISRADLRKKLITPGMSKSQSKLLTRVIRRLEAIACIRSVMALSQYSEITRKRYLSVKFIREPTEAERQTLFDDARLNGGPPGDQDDAENSEAEDELVDDSTIDGGRETTEAIHLVERLIPQWIPGTRLPNLIIKAVDQSGLKGMNNIVRSLLSRQAPSSILS